MRMRRRASRRSLPTLAAILVAVGALGACAPAPTPAPTVPLTATPSPPPTATTAPETPPPPPPVVPELLAAGLGAPWSVAFHGETAILSERDSARIVARDAQGALHEIGRVEGVAARSEGGLLGLAIGDGHLYAYFTTDADNRIVRFPLLGSGVPALGEREDVLTGIPRAANHNGGRLAFGPDGMLYATTGDAGDRGAAQDLGSLAGKILRMTPAGEVPADNPSPGSYVYTLGHRNPQGIGWGPDGTMYASEFGQDTWDELNVIVAAGNYGWPAAEGIAGVPGFIDPVQQWAPAEASPSGIAVTDAAIFVANLRGQRLREIPLAELSVSVEHAVGEYGRLRDAVVAPDGSIWVLTNNTDGRGSPGPDDDRLLRLHAG